MKVTLANITNNPIEEIYRAYKICYAKRVQEDIQIPTDEKMIDFIVPLMVEGHTSPLEHVSMTFYINDVSRALMAQLTRHRTAKFNIQSQRYVDGNNFNYVVPKSIIAAGLEEEYRNHMKDVIDSYNVLVEKGVPKEDARFILPNATTTNITMTIDLHNFRNFYGLRACVGAQWEIRALTFEMMDLVKEYIPFADFEARRCGKICSRCVKGE